MLIVTNILKFKMDEYEMEEETIISENEIPELLTELS